MAVGKKRKAERMVGEGMYIGLRRLVYFEVG